MVYALWIEAVYIVEIVIDENCKMLAKCPLLPGI